MGVYGLTLRFLSGIVFLIDDYIVLDDIEFKLECVHHLNVATALFPDECSNDLTKYKY